jgi:hypothetical protein
MNERIKELVKQATTIEEHKWGVSYDNFDREKFAELIVKECISTVENLSPGYEDYRNQIEDAFRRDCVEQMKQHFGVKK